MAFGGKQKSSDMVSARRLAAVAGGGSSQLDSAPGPAAPRQVSLQPDLSRIRPRMVDASPEARQQRLAAKAVNFTFTILARIIILTALGYFAWSQYGFSMQIPRGLYIAVFAVVADLSRVILKAMEPGTK